MLINSKKSFIENDIRKATTFSFYKIVKNLANVLKIFDNSQIYLLYNQ